MDLFTIITILIVLAAIFGYINVRYLKLPGTIGLMVIAIIFTTMIIISGYFSDTLYAFEHSLVEQIDFHDVLMDVMLSFLLFAGALHTNFDQLKVQRYPILIFATFGVVVSTFLVGTMVFYLMQFLGYPVAYLYCLLFGALISPTDPIAVLGILKNANVPKKLETKIVGESLFNDGIGVVVFLTLMNIAKSETGEIHVSEIAFLFVKEVFGGIAMGFALGYIAYWLMKTIDDYAAEIMITLALVTGGYLLANTLHLSGPLTVVVAGLIVGHDTVRAATMSEITEQYVDKFWQLVDEFLNAILFVLIGLEIMILTFNLNFLIAGILCIPIILLARFSSLAFPIGYFKEKLDFVPYTNIIMTWGGLRGGISIALALSLTATMERDLFVTITYMVVVFSIIVQGLTVGKLVKRLTKEEKVEIQT